MHNTSFEHVSHDKKRGNSSKSICCRNCGQCGHLYRECPHPITSFGIICFRVNGEGAPEYLMIQRKDSLSFMEFIRGKYDVADITYIKQLLVGMTNAERAMLLSATFEDLWNHVWYQPSIPRHSHEYDHAKAKFDTLFYGFNFEGKKVNLEEFITSSTSPYSEPEWGFPKGRRRLREEDVHCAVREFCEETRFNPNDIQLLPDVSPFEEIFFGTNHILYRHTYFLARFVGKCDGKLEVDPNNLGQAREVRALQWFSFNDVLDHIRHHNQERKQLFSQAHTRVVASLGSRSDGYK
jgi:8-oxo-dGTP pyrophosphatase MutT (NUDIX family)